MQEDPQIALRNLDRKHEAELRELDRKHESRLQELADLRGAQRLKVERLRTNVVALIDVAMKLGDREDQFAWTRFGLPTLVPPWSRLGRA